jgi:hypothetical protein
MKAVNVRPLSDAGSACRGCRHVAGRGVDRQCPGEPAAVAQPSFCRQPLAGCRTLQGKKPCSKQFERIGQTHLMEWPDPGYRCGIMLNAGRVLISPDPLEQGWNSAPALQGRALPGKTPEFYPPLPGLGDLAVRRILEALEGLRGGTAEPLPTPEILKLGRRIRSGGSCSSEAAAGDQHDGFLDQY